MFDERVRTVLPRVISPATRVAARAGVRPNHVSILGCLLGCAAAVLVAIGFPWGGLAVWVASRLLDGLDGILARETGTTSAFGGYLDITLDMAAYSAMVLGFAFAHPTLGFAWSAILASYVLAITTTLALSSAATSAGQRISRTNRTFQFTTSLAEAGETSVMYALWVLFPQWLVLLAWTWVAVVAVTVVFRSWFAYRTLR